MNAAPGALSVVLGGLLAACSSDHREPPASLFPPDTPETYENASAAIREAEFRAAIDGPVVELHVPITRRTEGRLLGHLRARLIDVSVPEEPILAEQTMAIDQRAEYAEHRLRLAGLPDGIARPDTAAIVVEWSARFPAGDLYGRRSLYAALGRLEVQLRGATDIPFGGAAPMRVIVRDAASGQPVSGAGVRATLLDAEGEALAELYQGETDDQGERSFSLALPAGQSGQSAQTEGGEVRLTVEKDGASTFTTARLAVIREERVALSTDKTIYKPGQDVHLRALALHASNRTPLSGRNLTFEALDGKGNKVFKRSATTDGFGVVAVAVPTDTEVNEGDWTFRVVLDEARTEIKRPVARYNLPRLKVAVTPEADLAEPGGVIRGQVDARYLFGLPVAEAEVDLQLEASGTPVASVRGVTDAEGRFDFAVQLPPDAGGRDLDQGPAELAILAVVTDTAGQREAGAATLPLVNAPLVLRALAEAGDLIPGIANQVFFLVSDAVGRPLVADVTIRGLPEPVTRTTDSNGLFELGVTPPAGQPVLDLELEARDGAGRAASRTLRLNVASAPRILLRPDRAVYAPGQTARIGVVAPQQMDRVYLDIYRGAEGVASETIPLVDGRGQASLPLGDGLGGVLVLDAFALGATGQVIGGTGRIMVETNNALDVRVRANAETFGPGEEATVEVSVTDRAGQPVVASVGLTAVDEAVFALGGEPDDDLRAWFALAPGTFPSDARVLGKAPVDLFRTTDAASLEMTARVLFASASGHGSAAFDYNSVREELPNVRSAVLPKIRRDAVGFLRRLSERLQQTEITPENVTSRVIGPARSLVDPFGQMYGARLDEAGDWEWMTLESRGPDERLGTEDDVHLRFYWRIASWLEPASITEEALNPNLRGGRGDVADFDGIGNPAAGAPPQAAEPPGESSGDAASARVRADFRETILVRPTLVTDGSGLARVTFPLADSITTWRVSAQASSQAGQIGSARHRFRTFQRFFVDFEVPTSLTMGDEVELPAVVYNYLEEPQTVIAEIEAAPWMTILGPSSQSLTLDPSEVRSIAFRVRVDRAGEHTLTLLGRAGEVTDALVRAARVAPSGRPELAAFSDSLEIAVEHRLTVPENAVEGGTRVLLALTPGFASQAVQGTEALLKEPNGCFEQTTSTAWPNTLVMRYLEATGQMTPELREQALGLVTRGYQRLLTFESPTGGFNWWGDSDPGNRILSAIFLWHLKDLEGLLEIDEAVRDRTLRWLVEAQGADGRWVSGDQLHSGNEVLGTSDARTTAFITWALAHTGWASDAVRRGAGWLGANLPDRADLYANALTLNALAMAEPSGSAAASVLARLDEDKQLDDADRVFWPTETPSWTGAGGEAAAIETTGLVAYGLLQAGAHPANAEGAMRFLVAHKDAVGSWYNTQATMNALRALLAAASPQGSDAQGTLGVTVNGQAFGPVSVTRENGDLYRTFDLTRLVQPGENTVQMSFTGEGNVTYQLRRVAYLPDVAPTLSDELDLRLTFDRREVSVGEPIQVRVRATYLGEGQRDQVMVRVGIPPGSSPRIDDLERIVAEGRAARFEVNSTHVSFYLMGLAAQTPRDLDFALTPTLAVRATSPSSEMYVYYEKSIRTERPGALFVVRTR